MIPDSETVANLIRETAQTHIMPRFDRLLAADVREKAPGDLVTVADVDAEHFLTPRLMALVPGSLVVGEEATAADPAVLDHLIGEEAVWLIDPVDGTSNFAAGMPLFAVMVAFIRAGELIASWIYDPVKQVMASAVAGEGAWSGGKRLSVAPSVPPASMSGAVSLRFGNRALARRVGGRSNLVGSVFSFRCAGQEYMALAAGRAHFAYYQRLFPWDHAPGVLLHREAGGYGRRLDGSPYTPRVHDGGLLLAPDEESWTALNSVLIAPAA